MKRKHEAKMNNSSIGIDSAGTWTASQYAIDAGWDYSCVEATARLGVSEADSEGLTESQQADLLAFCKARVSGDI